MNNENREQSNDTQNLSTNQTEGEGKKTVRRRRRKQNEPSIVSETIDKSISEAAKENNSQNSGGKKSRPRRRSSQKQKIYEVSNNGLPEDLPPIEPFDWEYTQKHTSTQIYLVENEGKKPKQKQKKGKSTAAKKTDEVAHISSKKTTCEPEKAIKREVNHDYENICSVLEETLLASGMPASRDTLAEAVSASPNEMEGALLDMLKHGRIFLTRRHKYALPEHLGYLSGTLQTTSRGFGFLLLKDGGDIFIAQNAMLGALNGDQVVVRLKKTHGASREGEVIAVKKRANTHIVGTLAINNNSYVIVPDNNRINGEFFVTRSKLGGAKEGQKVVAAIEYALDEPSLRIEEVLGFPDEVGTDVLSIIRAHEIPEAFPRHVLSAARAIAQSIQQDDILRREDLRKLVTVTIDGADSKDFDDAVSCEKLSNGNYLLGVHIADVTHYVKENSALDKEALRRGTSVYFIDRVIPMLPVELSNGICSLNPNMDRLTLSCIMEIDARGKVVSHRLAETVICSNARLVYEDVTALLQGDSQLRKRYQEYIPMLEEMGALAAILRARREHRGSIDFDLPEAKIEVNNEGKPIKITSYERGVSNKLIEEFMLICNETVAEHMAHLEKPMLYRVHEEPDEEKIRELNVFLGGFGYGLRGIQNGVRSKSLQSVLEKVKGKPEEGIISRVILRSMKKARYHDSNSGHFGLAAPYYSHFTSPIRRYPDLQVHRIVKDLLSGNLDDKKQKKLREKLPQIAQQCSERERAAMEAEREVDDLKKCEYMAQHIGETFEGLISGVTNFGVFVELPNTCEGMVRMADIDDDYYSFDEKNYRIVGRHTNKMYRLGDVVVVQVVRADLSAHRVEFKLMEKTVPKGRRSRRVNASIYP